MEDLSKLMVHNWAPAFQVATRWAWRNLPHVAQDVIEHAEALIASRGDTLRGIVIPQQSVAQDRQTLPTQTPQRIRNTQQGIQAPENIVEQPLQASRVSLLQEHRQANRQGETKGCVITKDSCLLNIEEGDQQVQRGPRQDATGSSLLFDIDISGEEELEGSATLTPIPVPAVPMKGVQLVQQDIGQIHRDGDSLVDRSLQDTLVNQTSTLIPPCSRVIRHINLWTTK